MPPLTATRFATVSDVFGPYVEKHERGALLVWAAQSDAGTRVWSALALTDRGEPRGQPLTLAAAPPEIGLVALRSLGADAGFVLVVSAPEGDGERVDALGIGPDGNLAFGPVRLASSAARILWVGAVPTPEGTLVLWAQKARDRQRKEPAEIQAVALDAKGEPKSAPQSLARDACAWQSVKGGGGAMIGVVKAHQQRCDAGPVELLRVAPSGKLQGAATVVSAEPSAGLDLDLTMVEGRALLVWSDRRGLEHRVFGAAVDEAGKVVVPPGAAVPSRGEQAVVALVAPHGAGTPAYVVWEDLAERPLSGRRFEIAPFGAEARAGAKRARLEYAAVDGRVPELAATARGVAALTLAPVCSRQPPCEGEIRPTFVEFDAALEPVASEPLRIDALEGKAVDLGWGLTCGGAGCFALAAQTRSPTPLFVTRLEARSNHHRPAGSAVVLPPPPRIVESEAIAAADPLAQLAVGELSGGRMVGFVTDFDPTTPWERLKKPAPDGRFEPLRARIGLFVQSAADAPLGPVQDLSLRAHSLGGLVLSPSDAPRDDVLAGWAGLDNGVPQVFLTLVSKQGARVTQRMLTRNPGDVSDVGLAFVGDGWLVAWIDERHDDAEVYAAKVNRALVRVGNEQRVTQAAGAAADLSLLPLGGSVLAVWTDAREAQTPGTADVFVSLLSPRDAKPAKEQRLFATRAHSFAPVVRAHEDGALVAWLEAKTEDASAGVYVGVLDAQAKWKSEPLLVPVDDGMPTALAVDCEASSCRVLVNVDLGGPTELRAFVIERGKASRLVRLTSLGGPSAAAVAPLLTGDTAYYADLNAERRGLLRRARIEWK